MLIEGIGMFPWRRSVSLKEDSMSPFVDASQSRLVKDATRAGGEEHISLQAVTSNTA